MRADHNRVSLANSYRRTPALELVTESADIRRIDWGGRLALVTLTDGTEHELIVDINDREISFDAYQGEPRTEAWLSERGVREELEERWVARKWED